MGLAVCHHRSLVAGGVRRLTRHTGHVGLGWTRRLGSLLTSGGLSGDGSRLSRRCSSGVGHANSRVGGHAVIRFPAWVGVGGLAEYLSTFLNLGSHHH